MITDEDDEGAAVVGAQAQAPAGTANQGTAAAASSSHAHSIPEDTDHAMAAGVAASLPHVSHGGRVRILDFHAARSYTLHTHE